MHMEGSSVRSQLKPPTSLDSLYLGNCQLVFCDIVQLITLLRVQKLVIWGDSNINDSNCIPRLGERTPSPPANPLSLTKSTTIPTQDVANVYLTKDALASKLSQYVSVFTVMDKEPSVPG
ncbi:hypothetical protein RSAG8_07314, partial [Rhizoctonia solani AG-8 WAC10335]